MLLVFIDDVDINKIEVVFVSGIDGESVALGVAKGLGREGLTEGTKEATI